MHHSVKSPFSAKKRLPDGFPAEIAGIHIGRHPGQIDQGEGMRRRNAHGGDSPVQAALVGSGETARIAQHLGGKYALPAFIVGKSRESETRRHTICSSSPRFLISSAAKPWCILRLKATRFRPCCTFFRSRSSGICRTISRQTICEGNAALLHEKEKAPGGNRAESTKAQLNAILAQFYRLVNDQAGQNSRKK